MKRKIAMKYNVNLTGQVNFKLSETNGGEKVDLQFTHYW
jgi:hypothetical protein